MEQIIVTAAKASPIREDEVPDVIIKIVDKIPTPDLTGGRSWEKMADEYYYNQASLIEEALYNGLPQGTRDRLTILMMKRHVSLYVGRKL